MFKMLRNKRGEFMLLPGLYLSKFAIAYLSTAIVMGVASYGLRHGHRARKAVELCYCMENGGSEYACKAEGTEITVEDGITLDNCKIAVENMTKPEVLDYIKDDVVLANADNQGNVN